MTSDQTLATEPRATTVNDFVDERPLSRFQLTTIVLCGIVLLLDGFDTQAMGFLVPPISEELGIPLASFGPVLSAGLFGLMIGAMSSGPIADRWGRRWAIIVSTVVFGLFSLLTAFANSLNGLVLLRFLTGLGLGGAMPNVVALSSEYAPKRLQPILVPAIFAGMAAGALLASIVGGALIPAYGWRSVFVVGGVLPIVLALILIKALPESLRFLAATGADREKIGAIVTKIDPAGANMPLAPPPASDRREGVAIKHLFTEGRAAGTIMLWIPFFMNLLILYFILSWLPSLLRQAGMPVSAGITAVAAFSVGGIVGSLMQGPLMKMMGILPAMLTEFIASLVLIGLASVIFENFEVMMVVTFLLGVCVQGTQGGLNVLAAMYYPTTVRATGVGWALGVGRIGSIVGPLIGGAMLAMQWTPQQIFQAGAVPAFIAGATVLLSGRLQKRDSPYRPKSATAPTAAH